MDNPDRGRNRLDDARVHFDPSHPFTRSIGLANGLTDRDLATRKFRRVFTGVYVDAQVRDTPALRAAAALLTVREPAFASHTSAARVRGVPIPALPDEHVTVLKRRDRRSRPGIVCHSAPSARVSTVDGVRISGSAQMFCELAALLPLVDLVVAGDWLVRHRHASRALLTKYATELGVRPRSARGERPRRLAHDRRDVARNLPRAGTDPSARA